MFLGKISKLVSVMLLLVVVFMLVMPTLAQDPDLDRQGWCEGVKIRFFAGGREGDAFASIVYRGALAAERDLGADVEYVFSDWQQDVMTQQLREAVAPAGACCCAAHRHAPPAAR